jgi:hypothetical protein
VLLALLGMGVGFHLGCGLVMGLNRFLWAFTATYPAVFYLHGLVAGRQVVPWEALLGVLWAVLLVVCWRSRPYSELITKDPARSRDSRDSRGKHPAIT